MKPVVPRALARRDAEEAAAYYANTAGAAVAVAFVDALESAYAHISGQPAAGSLRYAHELGLPDLRMWPLNGYPHLVFYLERDDHVDVWRVLHSARDIPTWMHAE